MFKKRTRTANPRVKEDYSTPPPRPSSSSTAAAAIAAEGESGSTAVETETRPVEDDEEEAPTGTLQEILLLRKLTAQSKTSGIDLVRLNKGEEKKKRKKKPSQRKDGDPEDPAEDEAGEEGEGETYGLKQSRAGRDEGGGGEGGEDAENDDASKARRLVRSNNFTQQTNALDVDKHMMAYIEAELAKRRQGPTTSSSSSTNPNQDSSNKPEIDPQEELYAIAEKYRLEKYKPTKSGSRGAHDDEEGGNVTTSLGMLTSIPEVDLGMDIRLKNIEETERAKRAMMENRNRNRGQGGGYQKRNEADESFAAARFYRPHHTIQSDAEALEDAKREAAGLPPLNRGNRQRDRNETATDDQVYERFKKRVRKN